jgi:hypothetical protein
MCRAHLCQPVCTMAKARERSAHPTLLPGPPQPTAPPPLPQIGGRVTIPRSEHEWKITGVRSEGRHVDLELPGTYLTRFRVDADTITFVDRVAPIAPKPARDTAAIWSALLRFNERICSDLTMT